MFLTSMVWIESKTIASDFFLSRVFVISKKDGKTQSFRHANDFPKKRKDLKNLWTARSSVDGDDWTRWEFERRAFDDNLLKCNSDFEPRSTIFNWSQWVNFRSLRNHKQYHTGVLINAGISLNRPWVTWFVFYCNITIRAPAILNFFHQRHHLWFIQEPI